MSKKRELGLNDFDFCQTYIGKKVIKPSGQPFKSGFKVNTVRDVIMHPILHTPAFVFVEDDSYVRCTMCAEHIKKELPLDTSSPTM